MPRPHLTVAFQNAKILSALLGPLEATRVCVAPFLTGAYCKFEVEGSARSYRAAAVYFDEGGRAVYYRHPGPVARVALAAAANGAYHPPTIMRFVGRAVLGTTLLVSALVRGGAAANSFADLKLVDQHEQSHTIAADTRTIVFTGDMDASKIVHALLGVREPDYLTRHRAVFIADIHRMPGLITRFIALPRMRRYPYRMLLIRDDKTGERFARREGAVTVVTLEGLQPVATSHVTSSDALERALGGEGP